MAATEPADLRYFNEEVECLMRWILTDSHNIPLILCGAFYAVLCVFSIVTRLIYMSGKRELNPLELSDSFMQRLSDPEKRRDFTKKMGLVTFLVGLVQGLTSFSILKGYHPLFYWIAVGFTVFSICSVCYKLKGRINAFPLLKLAAYLVILIVLLLPGTRALFLIGG